MMTMGMGVGSYNRAISTPKHLRQFCSPVCGVAVQHCFDHSKAPTRFEEAAEGAIVCCRMENLEKTETAVPDALTSSWNLPYQNKAKSTEVYTQNEIGILLPDKNLTKARYLSYFFSTKWRWVKIQIRFEVR